MCRLLSRRSKQRKGHIPEEDREESVLGVALVHYSMSVGIKKFKTKGKAGVTKELIQMHNTSMFHPVEVESLTYDKKGSPLVTHVSQGEEGQFSEDAHVRRQVQAERQHLVEAGDCIPNGGDKIGVHHCCYRCTQRA